MYPMVQLPLMIQGVKLRRCQEEEMQMQAASSVVHRDRNRVLCISIGFDVGVLKYRFLAMTTRYERD